MGSVSEITTNRFTSFSNNTITGNSYGFAGPLTTAASQYEFDNLDISTVATTNAIRSSNGYVNEFINSNFDVSKVNLQSTGAILSKNHNDSANDCQMLIPTGFNMDNAPFLKEFIRDEGINSAGWKALDKFYDTVQNALDIHGGIHKS